MKCTTIISALAFAVIFLSALFLFMRNYPSDRWFSVVFILAGGVSLWCVLGAEAGAAGETTAAENKIECCYDKPATSTVTDAPNENDEHGSIAGKDSEDGVGNGRCERKNDDGNTN
jgi:hypothetical protein